jgi:hypothetical protein
LKLKEGKYMRFINDDVVLVHDTRTAAYYSSTWELASYVEHLVEKCGFQKPQGITNWNQDDEVANKAMRAVFGNSTTIQEDNRFGVGVENFVCRNYRAKSGDIGKSLLGWNFMEHGLAFYGFIAGGDGQRGVFMILYHDGENVRLYTPRWGNALNTFRQEPLANDKRSEKYMEKYKLNKSTIGFNWDAIRFDILANISVDYCNVVSNHHNAMTKEEG